MSIKSDDRFDISLFIQNGGLPPSKIKAIRKKYGMTQAVFADLLGVIHVTYCSWELGIRNPSSPALALMKIADKYPEIFLSKKREIIESVMKYFGKYK